jgi:2-dehydropantoate 2-reductase
MKIAILGAGALGTVLGAHLARAGEDVTLIARGQRAAAGARSRCPHRHRQNL